jgi:hemicentin
MKCSCEVSIFFPVPPRIDVSQISLLDMEVIVNRSVIIQCPATSIPAPAISWFHDGREIDLKVDKHFELKRNGRELKINTVQLDHSGRYVCRASNPAGTAEQTYHLNVLGETSCLYSSHETMECRINRANLLNKPG